MATSSVNPNGFPKDQLNRTQKSFLNADFETVTLVKAVPPVPASATTSVEAALDFLGRDEKKLLKIIAAGLKSEMAESVRSSPDGWFDKETEEPYTGGEQIDSEKATPFITNFAKNLFGEIYKTDKAAAKAKAIEFLKSEQGAAMRKMLLVAE